MLKRVDRLQLVVPDRDKAATGWAKILGAELESEDRIDCLGARRSRWRVGAGRVEFLSPDGTGSVADALAARGAHLFAAGVSTDDFDGLMAHLDGLRIAPTLESGQAHLSAAETGGFGVRVAISRDEDLESVGLLDFFYETTVLVQDATERVTRCAKTFNLNEANFVPISSADYGYDGALTLFRANHLHRFEVITPNVATKTMGRYFSRFGQCYYMGFAESGQLAVIEERARAEGLGYTADPSERLGGRGADTLFLHPGTLGGVMLGISRRTMAWQWSGQPDKVRRAVP